MADTSHILIVDDDPDIRKVLFFLLKDNYFVEEAADGAAAVEYIAAHPETDLVVLDVMMPGMSGYEACGKIRALSNAPILFLTAKSAEADMISAYGSGGDDFLSKPFSQGEFLAKVNSLLRRYKEYRGKPAEALTIDGLEVDLETHSVKSSGKDVTLTDTEYAILEYLLKNRGSTVTAAELYESVWKERFLPGSGNTVMVHVLNLRRKIEETPSAPKIIRTVWGKGDQSDEEAEAPLLAQREDAVRLRRRSAAGAGSVPADKPARDAAGRQGIYERRRGEAAQERDILRLLRLRQG